MAQPIEDQRVFERFSADMVIWARPMGESGDFILVETANISAGGLLFKLDVTMERGTWIEVRFELPQNNDMVESIAQVRHVTQKSDALYLVGIEFTEVKNYTLPVLMAYLEAIYK